MTVPDFNMLADKHYNIITCYNILKKLHKMTHDFVLVSESPQL